VFAQNMIYKHSVTVYDSNFNLVATIPDTVDLSTLGHPEHPGAVQGGPVEAAFAPDGRDVYVSNYSMYGPGFPHPGDDTCSPAQNRDSSFVYRINVQKLAIDAAIAVGSTPKFLAVTPDDKYLIVSNWCSYDVSVVDPVTNQEVKRIPVGAYPRGIAIDPTSTTAYIAVMGSRDIAKLDLATLTLTYIRNVGDAPRHLVMDPSGQFLYATLNGDGQVIKIDLATGAVVARVTTGQAPRSMTIAPDGQSLYVVNYESNDVTKLAAADMHILQTVRTSSHPIGITYDSTTNRVWVACYSGVIMVFDDATA
jgi:YVTN family beta-propeller protein